MVALPTCMPTARQKTRFFFAFLHFFRPCFAIAVGKGLPEARTPTWICERERARDRVSARRAVRAGWTRRRWLRAPAAICVELGADVEGVGRLLAGPLTRWHNVMKRSRLAAHGAHALAVLLRRELFGVPAKRSVVGHALDIASGICERAHDGRQWSVGGDAGAPHETVCHALCEAAAPSTG